MTLFNGVHPAQANSGVSLNCLNPCYEHNYICRVVHRKFLLAILSEENFFFFIFMRVCVCLRVRLITHNVKDVNK
jgi:hypothetical protein